MPSRSYDPAWFGKLSIYTFCGLLGVFLCLVARKRDLAASSNPPDVNAISGNAGSSEPDVKSGVQTVPAGISRTDENVSRESAAEQKETRLSVDAVYKKKGVGFEDLNSGESITKGNHSAAVIWLHGLGDRPSGFYTQQLFQHLSRPEFGHIKLIAPAAPRQPVTCNRGRRMPSWFDILDLPFRVESPTTAWEDVRRVVYFMHGLLEDCISAGIPSSRIILGGFSQGAATTLVSALTFKEGLAGGMVLWGWMPVAIEALKSNFGEEGQRTPIYWSHGMQDEVVLHENAIRAESVLKEWGVNCTLTSHEQGTHSISEVEMEEVGKWLLLQLPVHKDALVARES